MGSPILVTRPSIPPFEEYVEEIRKIWERCWLTNNGPLTQELQIALRDYLQAEHLELYVNGHMALDIGIQALGLTGEVITTPFTFASTTHALVRNGLTPVFCDIKPDDFTIDESKVEALITARTTAILAVHVYGMPCNVSALQSIADKHGLKLIYDAAHAFGVKLHGRPLASYGDLSMLSFHATKVFHTIEGGALVFSDGGLAPALRSLRNFGIDGAHTMHVGQNGKMNEFSAAMGVCNLRHFTEALEQRARVVRRYTKHLEGLAGVRIPDLDAMRKKGLEWNYAYYPVLIEESICGYTRDELFDRMEQQEVHPRKYFYPLVTAYECYQERFTAELPVAESVAARILALPLYEAMTDVEIDRVCALIKGACE